jgi:phosphomannomutase
VSDVDPAIFKAYDVRGVHPDELDERVARRIGHAFACVLADVEGRAVDELRVALGRDMRLQAEEMAAAYADGLRDAGASVIDVGEVGTEQLYFAVGSDDLDGGIACTASHNPAAYTGAKLVRRGALALSGDAGIGELRDLVLAGEAPPAERRGGYERADVGERFARHVLGLIEPSAVRPMKVVLDGGNGMAGPMVGPLLDRLPLERVETYWTPDGRFPDHEPNPLLEENRRFVIERVLSEGAELGIAWDGDRCFFIDDTGRFVDGDFLTALLAESILAKEPGATILYDVRASRAVRDTVERAGGEAIVNRVGHAFFKSRMRETGAAFGGEVSGHYYFRDFFCADSGAVPALLILELLSRRVRTMSDLLKPLHERYFISGEINSEVGDQEEKMAELADRYENAGAEIGKLDGVSIDFDDWHFNVRPSNTEPLLRLNLESLVSEAHMEQRRDEVLAVIRS